jgi:hypothetical protein
LNWTEILSDAGVPDSPGYAETYVAMKALAVERETARRAEHDRKAAAFDQYLKKKAAEKARKGKKERWR